MACGIPLRMEGNLSLPTTPITIPPDMSGDFTGIQHLPALFNQFVSDCHITDPDMTANADDLALLASAPSIVEVEARDNQLTTILARWADWKQLAIAPQKSSVTLFTSGTHQYWLHPQVRIDDEVGPLNRTPKILDITLDIHFTFGPHAHDCIERALRSFNVMKGLAWSSWGFSTKTLLATYKAFVCPMINCAALIWLT